MAALPPPCTRKAPRASGHSAVGGSVGLSGVSTVLALQGAPDSTERRARQRAVERGDAMLDELEEIRLGLLLGTIPRAGWSSWRNWSGRGANRSTTQS